MKKAKDFQDSDRGIFRLLPVLIWIACIQVAIWPAKAESPPVALELTDGRGTLVELELGRSLFVQAQGLKAFGDGLVVLLDEDESDTLALIPFKADAEGVLDPMLLFENSGIVGCDCGVMPGRWKFPRFEHAAAELLGARLRVELRGSSGEVLATKPLRVTETRAPIAHTADASGCPRFLFSPAEDLYLFIRGGEVGDKVRAQLLLVGAEPAVDLLGDEAGEAFALHPPESRLLLWRAEDSFAGDLLPSVWSSRWPHSVEVLRGKHINSGLVVLDHSCPMPPR